MYNFNIYIYINMLCSKITPPGFNDPDALELKKIITEIFGKNKINIIQIGANDGISADPIYDYIIANENLNGFLVEPQIDAFTQLEKNYNDVLNRVKCYKYAITDTNSKIKLFKNNAVNGTDGHSSLIIRDLDICNDIVVADFKEDNFELVDGITVNNFMEMIGNVNIDVLIIDTEGYDLEIIKMFLNNNYYPKVIFFESPGIQGYIPGKEFLKNENAKTFIETSLETKYDINILKSNWLCLLQNNK